MVCFIVFTIVTVLTLLDIISVAWFMAMALITMLWPGIGAVLYVKFGFLKFYYHDFLKWHIPDDSPKSYDGVSMHATCKHCGKDIMQDSQGNWFR